MSIYHRSYQIDYFFGWRYFLSSKFRDEQKQKWSRKPLLRSLLMIGCFTSMLLTAAASILTLMAIWNVLV